jgi:hypothetical protein
MSVSISLFVGSCILVIFITKKSFLPTRYFANFFVIGYIYYEKKALDLSSFLFSFFFSFAYIFLSLVRLEVR